jgi:hypothetical protein
MDEEKNKTVQPQENTEETSKKINPLDSPDIPKQEDTGIIGNIVATETSQGEENILGDAPKLDTSLLMDQPLKKSFLLFFLKTVFSILFFASLASFLFFSSQLSSRFEWVATNIGLQSPIKELSATNLEIINLQTDVNLYNFLQIKSFLDRFSFYGDSFVRNYDIANSSTSSNLEKERARTSLQGLRSELETSFINARNLISKSIYVPLVDLEYSEDSSLTYLFESKLEETIMERASSVSNEDVQSVARRDYRNYMNTLNLIGNSKLKDLLIRTEIESLTDAQLYALVQEVNSLVVNDLSIIQEINSQRIRWSDIINEIELRTKAVDRHYSRDFFDTVGGVRYTSFDFDTSNRRISIAGETKTINTATFTMIADLIDELNSSSMFKNGEMRSFSKSGSLSDGYTGSLRLTLDLEDKIILTD